MAIYKKKSAIQLSKNFESAEFDCKCGKYCSQTEIDPALVDILQRIRDHFDAPVTINSAYRCEKHNKSVGGASKSKHLFGQAADIKVSGVKPLKIAQYAESIGVKGIGLYDNFVHVDTREKQYLWRGSEQDEQKTFGKYADSMNSDNVQAGTSVSAETVKANDRRTTVIGVSVNIRKGPGTNFEIVGKAAKKGQTFDTPPTDGWVPIIVDGDVRWISAKYAKTT